MNPNLTVVGHPAVADRLARLRDKTAPAFTFRRLVEELGMFLAYEATRGLPLRAERIATPLEETEVHRLAARPVVAPILRAGLGLLPGFLEVIDDAVVAHLGFYRDPDTLAAVPYYANLPDDLSGRLGVRAGPDAPRPGIRVPAALTALAGRGARNIDLHCASSPRPEGVRERGRARAAVVPHRRRRP